MILQFGKNKIEVDVEKTRAYYEKELLVSETCSCELCRNFVMAAESFSENVKNFFDSLGIDPRKVQEVFSGDEDGRKTVRYSGFTPFCGRVLDGGSSVREREFKDGSKAYERDEENEFAVAENISVDFENGLIIEDDSFPRPASSLIFSCELPWLLPEPKEVFYAELAFVDEKGLSFSDGEKVFFADCAGFPSSKDKKYIAYKNFSARQPCIEFWTRPRQTKIIFSRNGFFSGIRARFLMRKFLKQLFKYGYEAL